jgi:peptide chain release factor 1
MLNKLADLEKRYEELGKLIGDPEVMADLPLWQQYVKSHADLTDVVTVYREYIKVTEDIDEAKNILADEADSEMREMAQMELEELAPKKEQLEQHLKLYCSCPKIPMMTKT